jgi:hypothetical protein
MTTTLTPHDPAGRALRRFEERIDKAREAGDSLALIHLTAALESAMSDTQSLFCSTPGHVVDL